MENNTQAIERVNAAIKITANTMEQVAVAVKRIAEAFGEILPRIEKNFYKTVLTPKQYHLLLHGKKRVKKKWLNVARKRAERIYKAQKERTV